MKAGIRRAFLLDVFFGRGLVAGIKVLPGLGQARLVNFSRPLRRVVGAVCFQGAPELQQVSVGFGSVFQQLNKGITEACPQAFGYKISATLAADQQAFRCELLHRFP